MKSPTLKDRITRSPSILPVVCCISAVLWYVTEGVSAVGWEGFCMALICAYSLRKMNDGNVLMHARTWIVPSLLMLLYASMIEFHPLDASLPAVCLSLFSIYFLLRCWEHSHPEYPLLNSFLFLGVAVLFFPPLIFIAVVHLFVFHCFMNTLSLRTFLAAVFGLISPIEIAIIGGLAFDKADLIQESISMLTIIAPLGILDWSILHMAGFMCVLFFLGLGLIHFYIVLPTERIRIRLSFYSLILEVMALVVLTILMPHYRHQLLALIIALCCPLLGHYVVFSRGWFSNTMAICILMLIVFLMYLNLCI